MPSATFFSVRSISICSLRFAPMLECASTVQAANYICDEDAFLRGKRGSRMRQDYKLMITGSGLLNTLKSYRKVVCVVPS